MKKFTLIFISVTGQLASKGGTFELLSLSMPPTHRQPFADFAQTAKTGECQHIGNYIVVCNGKYKTEAKP